MTGQKFAAGIGQDQDDGADRGDLNGGAADASDLLSNVNSVPVPGELDRLGSRLSLSGNSEHSRKSMSINIKNVETGAERETR